MRPVFAIIFPSPFMARHGFGQRKGGAFCMHALMTEALLGTSKQAMHSASWVSMEIGRWVFSVLLCF